MTKDDVQAAHGWIDDVMFYAVSGGVGDPEEFKKRSRGPIQTIRGALLFTASTFIDQEEIKVLEKNIDPVNKCEDCGADMIEVCSGLQKDDTGCQYHHYIPDDLEDFVKRLSIYTDQQFIDFCSNIDDPSSGCAALAVGMRKINEEAVEILRKYKITKCNSETVNSDILSKKLDFETVERFLNENLDQVEAWETMPATAQHWRRFGAMATLQLFFDNFDIVRKAK